MFNDKLVLVGVAALSAVATAGWVRETPVTIAPQAFTAPMLDPAIASQPVGFSAPVTGVNHGVYQQTAPQPAVVQQASRVSTNQPVRARRAQNVYDDRRVYDDQPVAQKRSTAKSAAIIGGGAAAGAAIGGLAGGGKGAAIGAITGGAGGFVYDRMTRDKQSSVDPHRANDVRYEDDRNERSTAKSAMIVGGGAAAGAAVGGMAGGGKGAAIGALSGGAAGLIYDRMTKNK